VRANRPSTPEPALRKAANVARIANVDRAAIVRQVAIAQSNPRLKLRHMSPEAEIPVARLARNLPAEPRAEPASAQTARVLARLGAKRPQFLAFVRRRLNGLEGAEDLLQQALLKATEKAQTLRDEERAAAWFYRVLRRTLADHRARAAQASDQLELLRVSVESGPPEEVAICGCSLGLLAKMRAEYRDIIARADLDDEPIASIAEALGTTINNATVRLHRARKTLKHDLLTFCATTDITSCGACKCNGAVPS
jgi:DNA-directed RNA polymerase specialized sigma24 family protein